MAFKLPTRNEILDQEIITADWQFYYGNILDFLSRSIDGKVATSIQLSNSSIRPNQSMIRIDTENQYNTDELHFIDPSDVNDSQWLVLFSENENRKILVKNGEEGIGGIYTFDYKDAYLSVDKPMILYKRDDYWQQIDLAGYLIANENDVAEGTSERKVLSIAQIKPYLNNVTAAQVGVVVWAAIKPGGTLLASNEQEYDKGLFETVWDMLISGDIPSVDFATYNQRISDTGFCDDYALDEIAGIWKTPHLTSIKFGQTDYLPYIGAYNSEEVKNLISLQSLLDLAIDTYNNINQSSSDFTSEFNSSMSSFDNKNTLYNEELLLLKNNSVSEITTLKNNSLSEISDATDLGLASIEAKSDEIIATGNSEIVKVQTAAKSAVDNEIIRIEDAGEAEVQRSKDWAIAEDGILPENERSSKNSAAISYLFAEAPLNQEIEEFSSNEVVAIHVGGDVSNYQLVELYNDSGNWYKVFKETNPTTKEIKYWCEQGIRYSKTSEYFQTVNLLKQYSDANYNVIISSYIEAGGGYTDTQCVKNIYADRIEVAFEYGEEGVIYFETKGYINRG